MELIWRQRYLSVQAGWSGSIHRRYYNHQHLLHLVPSNSWHPYALHSGADCCGQNSESPGRHYLVQRYFVYADGSHPYSHPFGMGDDLFRHVDFAWRDAGLEETLTQSLNDSLVQWHNSLISQVGNFPTWEIPHCPPRFLSTRFSNFSLKTNSYINSLPIPLAFSPLALLLLYI